MAASLKCRQLFSFQFLFLHACLSYFLFAASCFTAWIAFTPFLNLPFGVVIDLYIWKCVLYVISSTETLSTDYIHTRGNNMHPGSVYCGSISE